MVINVVLFIWLLIGRGAQKKVRAKTEILSRKTSRQTKIYNLRYRQKEDEGRGNFQSYREHEGTELEAGFYVVDVELSPSVTKGAVNWS